MLYGWTGKLLWVDLTRQEAWAEELNPLWARDFIGGRGLGTKYLYEAMDPRVDPFSPDNVLIFATGPLTGTHASCGARYMVVTKGPLTGAVTGSNSGGHWGPELKFAGYDLLLIRGRASAPVYLWIYDDEVEIRDASHLWGKSTWDTEDLIRGEVGVPEARIAGIGPAGENLVRFACIINEKHRAAGRSGVGAVMGAKNLKAVAVRGTGSVRIADPETYLRACRALHQKLQEAPATGENLPLYGTAATIDAINAVGALPTRNFQEGVFEHAEDLNGVAVRERYLVTNKACFACRIACGRVTKVGESRYKILTKPQHWHANEGPEYENAWALGAACGVGELDAVLFANYLCNELGLDPISMGATLACAMEMYQRGILTEEQTGLPLTFGSGEALVKMVEATGRGEGFGKELALGSKRLAEKYGHPELHMGVKGQEFPAYDPRGLQGMGVAYATSNRGACHLRAFTAFAEVFGMPEPLDPHTTEGKAALCKHLQDVQSVVDATGLCSFLTFGVTLEDLLPVLSAATGVEYTVEVVLRCGERIWNLERLWNLKAGFTAADDTLPKRILEEPIPAGPAKGQVVRLHEMLPEYYRERGWTPEGEPTAGKLIELGLL
ncbi:MAG TPA: aldehyde ferredoxin oxidoreductase [Armatimonadetes bacterium]|nr:aldehyde ferredoxin oxidoreductase [Armatimonadota bacterium]